MGSYMPLFSASGSPRSPMSPRTLQAKMAWWLAIASVLLSVSAVFYASHITSENYLAKTQGMKRVIMKSFLLTPNESKLLYQSKPLLVAEEELSDDDIGILHSDQRSKEQDALKGLSTSEMERAAIVRQLISEFSNSEPLSEEMLEKLQKQWEHFSVSEEDVVDFQSNEASYPTARYPDEEDEESHEATLALEYKLESYKNQEDLKYGDEDGDDDFYGSEGSFEEEDSTYPSDAIADLNNPLPHLRQGEFTYLEVLSNCDTLQCLKRAHEHHKEPNQFNFPHSLITGWHGSGVKVIVDYLAAQSHVINALDEESDFFSHKCTDSPVSKCDEDAEANFIANTLQRDAVVAADGKKMSFEASTHYAAAGDLLASDIAATFPWLKVVLSLREPISRALKDTSCRHSASTEDDLYECLSKELIEATESNSYSHAMSYWMRAFPRNQIYMVQYEALVNEEAASLRKLIAFLDIEPEVPHNGLQVETDTLFPEERPIWKDHYLDLISIVRPDVERLAGLIEEHGLGPREAWLSRWEQVWEDTLASCTRSGRCYLKLI